MIKKISSTTHILHIIIDHIKMFKIFYLITILVIFLKANTFLINDTEDIQNISSKTSFIEDKSKKITFEQIKDKTFEDYKKEFINFGVSDSVYWFKIELNNNTEKENFVLEISSPFFDNVKIYQKNEQNNYFSKESGNSIEIKKRDIFSNSLFFNINLKQNQNNLIYLKVYSGEYKYSQFIINIGTLENFYEKNSKFNLFNGIYFGFVFIISLYCIVLFLKLKEKIFIYYALSSLSFAIVIAYLNGYTYLLWGNNFWLNKHVDIFNYILSFFLTLFCIDFLQTKKRTPYLHIGLIGMIFYYFIFIAINILDYMKLSRLGLEFASLFGIYALIISIIVFFQGYKVAKYYIIAQGSFFLFVNIFVLSTLSIIPYNDFTANSLQIGSILEIFFLSFAISEKINMYKKEKDLLDKMMLIQSQKFSEKLIENQENDKKRVSTELHDSLGQNIILIKNKLLSLTKNKDQLNIDDKIIEISKNIDNISDEIRNISYSLHPFHLKSLGLTLSLKELIEDFSNSSDINFNFEIDEIDSLFSEYKEVCFYRIIQECLSNILKHSKAKNSFIKIEKQKNNLDILITDDGIGFDSQKETNKNGFGIIGIKERLKLLNGSFNIFRDESLTKLVIKIKLN